MLFRSPLVSGARYEGWPAWTPDGTGLVFTSNRTGVSTLWRHDLRDGTERQLVRFSDFDSPTRLLAQPAVSPDGRTVAYVFWRRDDLRASEICVVDIESGAVRTISGEPALADRGPAWSPDGAWIAFASERSGWYEVHLIRPDGSDARQLTADGADFHQLAWSPDGTRLAASRCRRGRFDLVAIDAATGAVEVLEIGRAHV